MHTKMLKDATDAQLREFIDDALKMIKETNHCLYEDLELYLYKEIYGCHFNEWMLDKALSKMINEDGSTGAHWNLTDTNNLAKQVGISFTNFNEYDWNYVLNMIYSDYYGSVNNDVSTYAKLARKFIEDKDAPEGKALKYYLAMK